MMDAQTLSHFNCVLVALEKLNELDDLRAEQIRALSHRIEALTNVVHRLDHDVTELAHRVIVDT